MIERRARRTLLTALAVDNVGSGLFMPLNVIFLTRAAGLSLPAAGWTLTAGTAVGVAVPYLAAGHVDRRGPRPLIVLAMACQGVAMFGYLLASMATSAAATVAAALTSAALNGIGIQLFYSALGVMIVRVATGGATDDAFARVSMVRTAAFGVGGLLGGLLISGSTGLLRAAVAVNAATFLAAAVLVSRVHTRSAPRSPEPATPTERHGWSGILRDRSMLMLVPTAAALGLGVDLFLVVMPAWAQELGIHGWAVGLSITVNTALGATLAGWSIARTSRLRRSTSLALALMLLMAWTSALAALGLLPTPVASAALVVLTVLMGAATLLAQPRLAAIVAAIAPVEAAGRHFAALQYAYTATQLAAPLAVTLLSVGAPWPWLAYLAVLAATTVLLIRLRRSLPATTDGPAPS